MKSQITQKNGALNVDEKLSKNHSDVMLTDRVIVAQSYRKVPISFANNTLSIIVCILLSDKYEKSGKSH